MTATWLASSVNFLTPSSCSAHVYQLPSPAAGSSSLPTTHSVPLATPLAVPHGLNSSPVSELNAVVNRKPPDRRMQIRCLAEPKPLVLALALGIHRYGNPSPAPAASPPAPTALKNPRRPVLNLLLFLLV